MKRKSEKDSSEKKNLGVNKSDIAVNKSDIDVSTDIVEGGRAILVYAWLCSVANYIYIYLLLYNSFNYYIICFVWGHWLV